MLSSPDCFMPALSVQPGCAGWMEPIMGMNKDTASSEVKITEHTYVQGCSDSDDNT